jgi:pimeloyl-ACP methyl ester carboxylesterase
MTAAAMDDLIDLDGRRVRVRLRGDGRPVLLLNGIGAPLETWLPLQRHLTGLRTIAYDTLGSGRSQSPRGPLPIAGHARLALRLLDELGHGTVAALGFSFGGLVAQELARLGADRVDRLVLASTSCGWGGLPGPASLVALAAPEAYFSASLSAVATDRDRQPRRPRSRRHRLGHLNQFWAAATWSSVPWLHRVRQPTLLIAGAADPIVPAGNATILAALLPHAELHVVPRGGHLCLLERAAELAPLLHGFLLPSAGGPGRSHWTGAPVAGTRCEPQARQHGRPIEDR